MQIAAASHDKTWVNSEFCSLLNANPHKKMSRTLLMCSIMIIPTTQRIMCIESAVQVVLVRLVQLLHYSPPKVCSFPFILFLRSKLISILLDAKQVQPSAPFFSVTENQYADIISRRAI